MNIPGFLKRGEKDSVLMASSGELVFYIPETYFEREFAVIEGEVVTLIGIFQYALFEEGSSPKLTAFNFPSKFSTIPTEIVDMKQIRLTSKSKVDDYKALKYRKDAVVMVSSKVPMVVENMEDFLKMYNSGAMPNIYPYHKLHEIFKDNATVNGNSYGVNESLIGIIISESARSIEDKKIPYRLSGSNDPYAYEFVNIKEIPNLISPFTALTSENWNESVANAIINKKPGYSPLERLFINDAK